MGPFVVVGGNGGALDEAGDAAAPFGLGGVHGTEGAEDLLEGSGGIAVAGVFGGAG